MAVLFLISTVLIQFGYYLAHTRGAVLYRDEANDCFTARDTWSAIYQLFTTDWDPYTWILGLKFWTWMFGTSETSLRGICFACLVLATLFMYKAVKRWSADTTLSLAAAIMLGLGSPMLQVAVGYARPYAMALLTTVLILERYLAVRHRPTLVNLMTFGAASLLFGNIQPVNYAFAAALVAVSLVDAWRLRSDRRVALRHAILLPGLMGLLALPSLIQSYRFSSVDTGMSGAGTELPFPAWAAVVAWRSLTSILPGLNALLQHAFDDNPAGAASAFLANPLSYSSLVWLAVGIGGIVLLFIFLRPDRDSARFADALLLVLLPVFLLALGSMKIDRLAIPFRSYAAFAPGMVLMLVLMLGRCRPLLWTVLFITILQSASVLLFYQDEEPGMKSDAKAAAAWMQPQVNEDDVILLANPAIGPSFHYYFNGAGREVALPFDGPVLYWNDIQLWKDLNRPGLDEEAEARVAAAFHEGRRVWFVWGGGLMDESSASWHPYFAPRSFEGARRAFHRYFNAITGESFEQTTEQFHVELYEPKAASEVEDGI